MMALDYDAADESPSTASQMLNMNDRAGGPVWQSTRFNANLAAGDKSPSKYTRNSSVSGQDIKTFDVGNLFVTTQGVAAGTVGLLYIEYIIDLFTPQMTQSQQQVSGSIVGDGTAAATIFGTAPITYGNPPVTAAGKTLTFTQDFEGMVVAIVTGTVLTNLAETGTATYNMKTIAATSTALSVVNFGIVKGTVGQTMIFTATGTTFGGIVVYVADGVLSALNHLEVALPPLRIGQNVATPQNASSVTSITYDSDTDGEEDCPPAVRPASLKKH